MAQQIPIDPDKGINDLVRQLTDDARRLVTDEARLAKLEAGENLHGAWRGAVWLGIAFGVLIVSLVAFTIFLAALAGRVAGHYWIGAALAATVEIALGLWLVRSGTTALKRAPYSLPETRSSLSLGGD